MKEAGFACELNIGRLDEPLLVVVARLLFNVAAHGVRQDDLGAFFRPLQHSWAEPWRLLIGVGGS
jgi:hypothetical protein